MSEKTVEDAVRAASYWSAYRDFIAYGFSPAAAALRAWARAAPHPTQERD